MMSDQDRPLGPAEMLQTLERQQQRTVERTAVSSSLLYLTWGLALIGGNLAMFVGVDRATLIPPVWSALVYLVLLVGAGVVTGWHIRGRTTGLSGPDLQRSAMWGWSWPIAFAGFYLLGGGLVRAGADGGVTAHYFAIGALILVGVQYLAAGAVYRDRWQYLSGVVVLAGAGGAALLGLPAGYLVMAAVCGGGLLVVAAADRVGVSRGRP